MFTIRRKFIVNHTPIIYFNVPTLKPRNFDELKPKVYKKNLQLLAPTPSSNDTFLCVVLQFTNKFQVTTITACDGNQEPVLSINEQIKIEFGNFVRGIIEWRFIQVQHECYRSQRNEKWASFFFTFSRSILS